MSGRVRGRGMLGTVLLALVITLVIGSAVVFLLVRSGKLLTKNGVLVDVRSEGPAVVLPKGASGSNAFITVVHDLDNHDYALARVNPPETTAAWVSGSLSSKAATDTTLLTDGHQVFVAEAQTVTAFDAGDGHQVWTAKVSDIVDQTCAGCLFLAGPRLVVSSKDAVFHAFDSATGKVAWDKRGGSKYARVEPFADKTLLEDEDANGQAIDSVLDADGAESGRFEPTCPAPEDAGPIPADSVIATVPLAQANAVVFGTTICWRRMDLATGTPTWTTPVPPSSSPVAPDAHVSVQGTRAAIVAGGSVATLDLGTGTYKALSALADVTLAPVGVREDTFVVRSTSTRGTAKYALLGIDLGTGATRWTVDLATAEPSDAADHSDRYVVPGFARFTLSMQPDAVRVVAFDRDSRQLTLHHITVTTGQDDVRKMASGDDAVPAYFGPIGWDGATALISFDSSGIVEVDTAKATINYRGLGT